ncbi:MAG: STAS domain-containing protein [Oscillospiraceae bacterium]|jgi:anti-anti-sigma factor|nr:STAS domain-containing protein [Oscillospiraceae bacterium]
MTIDKKTEDGRLTLKLTGRLDTTTAPELQKIITSVFNETNEVVLDFAELTYISSAGLRVLLIGQKAATSRESGKMILTNVLEEVMEILEMTGFDELLDIE